MLRRGPPKLHRLPMRKNQSHMDGDLKTTADLTTKKQYGHARKFVPSKTLNPKP